MFVGTARISLFHVIQSMDGFVWWMAFLQNAGGVVVAERRIVPYGGN